LFVCFHEDKELFFLKIIQWTTWFE